MTTNIPTTRPTLLVACLLLITSCAAVPAQASPSADPSGTDPTRSALPTARPSETPATSSASPPASAIGRGIVQVVADGLQLRAAAGTTSPVVGGLERGAVARIESEPVEADGHVWYEVVDVESNRGWVAAGDDEDPWLVRLDDQTDESILLRLETFGHVSPPASMPLVTVMDDRRAVFGGVDGGWSLGRLTDAGFASLSDSVLESPYLQASAEYVPVLRPGITQGPPHGQGVYRFTLGAGGDPIVVRAVQWFGEEEEAAFFEPSPERRALDGIVRDLISVEQSLGGDAWVADPLPYIGPRFLVMITEGGGGSQPPEIARVDPGDLPVAGLSGDPVELPPEGICADLPVADAFELVRILRAGGSDLALETYTNTWIGTDDRWFGVSLSPQAPDGFPGCDEFGR